MPESGPSPATRRGVIIAAPASGAGKTLFSLALCRALARHSRGVQAFKTGPDYIDSAYLSAASGRPAYNLDPWAMPAARLGQIFQDAMGDADWAVVEGVMGLFDGAADGTGSTADLARALQLPVLLIINAAGSSASLAAVAEGFTRHQPDLRFAGILFNQVGSARHQQMIANAMRTSPSSVLGYLRSDPSLQVPSRHLGLVQADELEELDDLLHQAADRIEAAVDLERLDALCRHTIQPIRRTAVRVAPIIPAQRIAVADDVAFRFHYRHLFDDWYAAGSEIIPFSPLSDQAPDASADLIFLPGGYPELHAGKLAAAQTFHTALQEAARRNVIIYGECGGFMVLGEALIDREGKHHRMAGMLPLVASFAKPSRHLGYRRLSLAMDCPLGLQGATFLGHEFHYSEIKYSATTGHLFDGTTADNRAIPSAGLCRDRTLGSFMHVIGREF